MNRSLAMLYGGACYTAFLATFLYAIAFVAGFGVPKHIDNGALAPLWTALAIDIALLALFAVQHSGMARPAFKRWWTRFVPTAIERSTFVLVSSAVLALLFWLWRPLPQVVWHVDAGLARGVLWGVSLFGWLLVLTSSFTINHFELFGLRQVWLHARGRVAKDEPFVIRAMYRIVRHPLMLGFLIAFWVTPTMTLGHLLFAAVVTGYIFVAVKFLEERDLVAMHGDTYRDYQRKVPMLLPGRRRS
ncbi:MULTISPECIES: methanethiol S-methyltransferase [unclassified Pseudoxanthomonas]|uniref:methanethiol S-methyltransferase n=1 Tax=unclassified Pseudoxanthomonas TaxID=2645906 RepID=UPI0008EE48D6|nr:MULTISPECIES: methanethiol S-methyltransferase [unclassified Pseudoxanthomonas]PPJ43851.1 isoprenylcysteine carboxylmethyltransferase family protein [Pseudoxanthomonas sp. KAs_5_3]SFV36394.1 Protein-S-isoprenylcysteine O-methyltransferase Ste14 [Pseudoxanthomonas sp. YR558]